MTKKVSRQAELRINWYNDGKGYGLSSNIGSTPYPKFEDLAGAVADFLDLNVPTGFSPEPYRLFIGRRARRQMGEGGVKALETIVKHHNMVVRARRELGDVEDD